MKTTYFLFLAMAFATLTACSSDESGPQKQDNMRINLGISVNSASATRSMTDATAMQDDDFVDGAPVDIFIYEKPTNSESVTTTYGTNGLLACTVSSTSAGISTLTLPAMYSSTALSWPTNHNSKVNITGYYPHGVITDASTATEKQNFMVQADQSSIDNYKASDLMYGQANSGNDITRTNDAQVVAFTHKLSKINIELTAGTGLTAANLEGAQVSIVSVQRATNIVPNTGALATATTSTISNVIALMVSDANTNSTIDVGELKGSAIIVPQTITELDGTKEFIRVTLNNGGVLSYKPADPMGGSTNQMVFNGSKKYTYQITVNLTGLTVQASITNWGTETYTGNSGNAVQ